MDEKLKKEILEVPAVRNTTAEDDDMPKILRDMSPERRHAGLMAAISVLVMLGKAARTSNPGCMRTH